MTLLVRTIRLPERDYLPDESPAHWSCVVDDVEIRADDRCSVHETAGGVCVLDGWLCGGEGAAGLYASYQNGGIEAAVSRDGHFTAVVLDRIRHELHLLNDTGGFGHAYLWTSGHQFGYSTDLRRLAWNGISLSHEGMALYLAFQYVPAPYTIFEDIRRPQPGTVITRRHGRLSERHVDHRPPSADDLIGESEEPEPLPTEPFFEVLTTALRERTADVERLGMTLSGGIDTSTNAVLLTRRLGRRPVAYTASFAEAGYDESDYAALVADHLELEHIVIPVRPSDLHVLPRLVRDFETPNADQAAFATHLLATAAAERCDLMVTGEGGDEVLGFPMSPSDDIHWASLPGDSTALARLYLNRIRLADETLHQRFSKSLDVPADLPVRVLAGIYEEHRARSGLDRLLFGQWRTWLTEGVYMKDTRVFGGAGLDTALPFADPRVLRFVASLQARARYDALDGKELLRSGIRGHLPPAILTRAKHKFWIPFEEWFRGPLRDQLHDSLLSRQIISDTFEHDIVRKLVEEHDDNVSDHSRVLWSLIFLYFWLDNLPSMRSQ
ncbi:asparagine synthetase B family protein [Nonomuraea glycinis]|uniref:asparagine synthetase B family protein n=1 Tax=Nonomuraea glycinis TaxID=2047744 RepID=UPI002E116AD5|nr:asparagine synthase C-terminal domain-containing protein [Nonomuraea glycinis]